MDFALDRVERYWVVRWIWSEDRDGVAGGEGVDGCLVGFWVALVVGWVRVKGRVEAVVRLRDVFIKVLAWRGCQCAVLGDNLKNKTLTDCGKLVARRAHHAQLAYLASASQVE